MNNYFGIGLDAKIALDFHTRREEHPEKFRLVIARSFNLVGLSTHDMFLHTLIDHDCAQLREVVTHSF